MLKSLTNSITKLVVLSFVLAGVLTVNYLDAAWRQPIAAPTGGNVDLPINTGSVTQDKDGVLTVGALGVSSLAIVNGGTRSLDYCDLDGNNCSTPVDIYNTVNASSIDTSTFIDNSSDAQTKAGPLTIDGGVNSTQYCDENGANCVAAADLGGGGSSATTNSDLYCDENGANCFRPENINNRTALYRCPYFGDHVCNNTCAGQLSTSNTCTQRYRADGRCTTRGTDSCSFVGYLVN